MATIDVPIDERTVVGYDGTPVTYYMTPRGKPVWVLAPGLGTHVLCWKYLFEHFAPHYTLLTWDPRGTYKSGIPREAGHDRVEDHAADLDAICAAEGLQSFVLGGWSMGVQISLEYQHAHPERVRALVLINGAYEHVLSTALGIPGAEKVFDQALAVATRLDPVIAPVTTRLFRWDGLAPLLVKTQLLAVDNDVFRAVLKGFSGTSWRTYFPMMRALNRHSCAPYLAGVKVPTLVTAGTRDFLTPVKTAVALARAIPGADLHVVEGGTHYTLTEFPQKLHEGIERFLRRVDPASFGLHPDLFGGEPTAADAKPATRTRRKK